MDKTRLSLCYLFSYLILAGVALIVDPETALKLFMSTGEYGDVMPRLLGVMLLSLGIIVVQAFRHRLEPLYPTTLVVRAFILASLFGLYFKSGDPLFLVLIGVVGLGFVATGASYLIERRR